MSSYGRAAQAPVWALNGNRLALTFHERPPAPERLSQRCLPPARELGLQTSWSADVLGSFNGSVTWAEALKLTAYTAELERKTMRGAGGEEHLLARLQRDHALTHAELQASRRHFAMLLGRCIEEAAVLRLEPHSSAQGEVSVSGGLTGRSLSCKVKTDFNHDTSLVLDTNLEGGSSSAAASSGSVLVLTAKPDTTQQSSREKPKDGAHANIDKSRGLLQAIASKQRAAVQLPVSRKLSAVPAAARALQVPLPAETLHGGLKGLTAAKTDGETRAAQKEQSNNEAQNKSNGEAQGGIEQAKSGSPWQLENPLKLLSARAAFPLGASAQGGWRLSLSQRISERLYMDAKLRGGSARAGNGTGKIVILEHGSQQSTSRVCNASSTNGEGAGRRSAVRPSGGQMRLELRQPSGLRCSVMVNSSGRGPVFECKWRGMEAKRPPREGKRPQSTPTPSDAEQVAMERGRQWHSWHLNRLEMPAWRRPMTASLPSIEARVVMKSLRGRLGSLHASVFMPL